MAAVRASSRVGLATHPIVVVISYIFRPFSILYSGSFMFPLVVGHGPTYENSTTMRWRHNGWNGGVTIPPSCTCSLLESLSACSPAFVP